MDSYNLVIVKADKGQTVVIMYKTSYVEKMHVILNDNSKFVEVEKEETLTYLSRFQSFLCRNFKSILSSQILYFGMIRLINVLRKQTR